MRKVIVALTAAMIGSAAMAAVIFDSNFSAGEGYTEGASPDGVGNWDAQAGFVTTDVAGEGYLAVGPGGWGRAENWGTWNSSETTVTVTTKFRALGATGAATIQRVGFADSVVSVGGTTPEAYVAYNTLADSSLNIDGVAVSIAQATDWLNITTVFTKLGTAGDFSTATTVYDAGMTLIGSSSGSINAPIAWAAPQLQYGMRLFGGAAGTTADFSQITVDAIPEPATLGLISVFGAAIMIMRRLKI